MMSKTTAKDQRKMQTETVSVESLSLDPSNVRKHNERNLDSICASLRRFGQQHPIIVSPKGVVIAGNGRLMAMKKLGWGKCDVVRTELDGADAVAFAIADNRTAELAEWDDDALATTLAALQNDDDYDHLVAGFDDDEIQKIIDESLGTPGVVEDEVPEPPADPVTKPGDLWLLGDHRVLCGDSTKAEDVGRLMGGEKSQLIHADPPYGMGKENEGVTNDNLYAEKLDSFQMDWWRAFRPYTEDSGSVYIWGTSEDLWRLWYLGGLKDSERLTMRNEIVWEKQGGIGIASGSHRMYPTLSERCLFFMLGEQGFNTNADNYWEGWEPIRLYLETEMDKCGGKKKWKEALGSQMGSHYFTRSQWCFPTEEAYKKLQDFAKGNAFKREHDELKREFYATRAFFDNTHDNMGDVWHFGRVSGEERHGHATPKPVEMIARCLLSSTIEGAIVAEPFLGSGTTLIAAEQLNRKCYGIEISPAYCDVIVERWENLTGQKAVLDG